MKMSEICVKVAISAITAMAAGTASILASEGTKKGLAILMNPRTPDTTTDPVDTVAETVTETMTDAMDIPETVADEPSMEPEVETEVEA